MQPTLHRLVAPCVRDCPAGIDVPRYIGYIALGKFSEAVAVVRERIPLPAVCGYVCYRPCEPGCRRGQMDTVVAINALKRAATDRDGEVWRQRWEATIAPPTGKRVAIIGSGPAGLTTAYYLGKVCGHSVTVFEALPQPGGQLVMGIPSYRLPREIIEQEIAVIGENRVELRCGTPAESLDDLMAHGYDAVLIATGTCAPQRLNIPGEGLRGVWEGVHFLKDVNLGGPVEVGQRVVVIGGGNVAIDCSRTALRLGAQEVTIAYRRSRQEMPAYDFEVHSAEEEGVCLEFLAAPVRIKAQGGALRLRLIRMELGEPDASGRRRPVPIPGSEFEVEVDTVLAAIGQVPQNEHWGLELDRNGTIKTDPESSATSRPSVFAAGDTVTGPVNVIQAIAGGRKAAQAIDRYLGGSGEIAETLAPQGEEMDIPPGLSPQGEGQVEMAELELEARRSFDLVELGYGEEESRAEALRCIRCDLWRARGVPDVWPKKKSAAASP
ncbi:MAG: FAD-dependent oxidoreductase [Dehalococcoidia bacterium]